MKVILVKDVKDLGKKDEMVNVSDGYGKNYLLPRGIAIEATEGNINEMKNKQKAAEARAKKELDNAVALGKEIEGKKVTLRLKAGENGKLFGAVNTKDVADALKAQCNIEIDKKKIVIDDAIKAVGTYKATVKIYAGVSADINLEVIAE